MPLDPWTTTPSQVPEIFSSWSLMLLGAGFGQSSMAVELPTTLEPWNLTTRATFFSSELQLCEWGSGPDKASSKASIVWWCLVCVQKWAVLCWFGFSVHFATGAGPTQKSVYIPEGVWTNAEGMGAGSWCVKRFTFSKDNQDLDGWVSVESTISHVLPSFRITPRYHVQIFSMWHLFERVSLGKRFGGRKGLGVVFRLAKAKDTHLEALIWTRMQAAPTYSSPSLTFQVNYSGPNREEPVHGTMHGH